MSASLYLDGCLLQATNYANEFVLLRPGDSGEIDLPTLGRKILDKQFAFIEEVIATEVEICLKLNQRFRPDSLLLIQQIKVLKSIGRSVAQPKPLQVPICFSSRVEDWQAACEQIGLGRESCIEELLACRFYVAMLGFLPGFLYLRGLPAKLQVPRKDTPDKRTSANAFALGGKYAGIYSLPSPAGWHVIGSLAVPIFQPNRLPPVLLQPGDELVLQEVSEEEFRGLVEQNLSLEEYNGLADSH